MPQFRAGRRHTFAANRAATQLAEMRQEFEKNDWSDRTHELIEALGSVSSVSAEFDGHARYMDKDGLSRRAACAIIVQAAGVKVEG
jgi:hypothetical protein